jgi:DNA-binding LytR/AlgR family response regulator
MKRDVGGKLRERSNEADTNTSIPLNCIAIDDDNLSLSILKRYCEKLPFLVLNEVFDNPLEALNHLKNNQPDLVFLDINMPEVSGICIAQRLKGQSMVIFTTSHKHFAHEGFNLNAIDFLIKPFEFDRFYQAVEKAKDYRYFLKLKGLVGENHDYIIIKEDYQNVKVNLSDILFIEALDNYVKIHTSKRTFLTLKNLKTMDYYLNSKNFMRVHKSYIVALDQIDYFSRDQIHINGSVIPIGRTFAKKFRNEIKN